MRPSAPALLLAGCLLCAAAAQEECCWCGKKYRVDRQLGEDGGGHWAQARTAAGPDLIDVQPDKSFYIAGALARAVALAVVPLALAISALCGLSSCPILFLRVLLLRLLLVRLAILAECAVVLGLSRLPGTDVDGKPRLFFYVRHIHVLGRQLAVTITVPEVPGSLSPRSGGRERGSTYHRVALCYRLRPDLLTVAATPQVGDQPKLVWDEELTPYNSSDRCHAQPRSLHRRQPPSLF